MPSSIVWQLLSHRFFSPTRTSNCALLYLCVAAKSKEVMLSIIIGEEIYK